MAAPQKMLPRENKQLGLWMGISRTLQTLATLTIMGLDGFVIEEYNKNQFNLNSSLNLSGWVGATPFSGLTMFTVSHPTLMLHGVPRPYVMEFKSEEEFL